MTGRWPLALLLAASTTAATAQTTDELKRMIAERDATIAELRLRLTQPMAGEAAPNGDGASAPAASPPAAALGDERRALERALVREGSSVLPVGEIELEPELSYAHWDAGRDLQLRSTQELAVSLRVGLPGNVQAELRVPYLHNTTATDSGSGSGNVDLGFTKELARERDGRPSLLGWLGYTIAARRDGSDGTVPLGSGYRAARAGLTVTYRLDPLVVFGSASYEVLFPKQVGGVEVAPGNVVGLRLGSALAASPRTSMSAAVSLGFPQAMRIGGVREPDSDAPWGTLQLGLATVLSPSMLLNIGSEFRVMGSAPDLRLTISLPIRY